MEMENNTTFFAEFLPLINSMNIYVDLKKEKFIDVRIDNKAIIIKCKNEFIGFNLCKGISLVPSSQKAIEITSDNFLVLQAQAEKKSVIINSVLSSLIGDLQRIEIAPLSMKLQNMNCINFRCKRCHNELTNYIELKRVCALPFEDFHSAAENWFCHHHSDNSIKKKLNLSPDEDEVFYSDFQYWINSANLSFPVEKKEIVCTRCKLIIGTHIGDLVKLWVNDVEVGNEDGLIVKEDHEIFGSFVNALEQQNLSNNMHIVFDQEGKEYLSVIVVDCNHTLVVSAGVHLRKTNKDMLKSTNWANDLTKITCYKVLYSLEEVKKKSWSHQLATQMVSCNQRFFHSIYTSLKMSTEFMPEKLRTVNNVEAENVGFIFRK